MHAQNAQQASQGAQHVQLQLQPGTTDLQQYAVCVIDVLID